MGPDRVLVLRHRLIQDRVLLALPGAGTVEGELAGVERRLGLALLRVETGAAPPVRWAPQTPPPGTTVFALGDPGTGLRITAGMVSCEPFTVRSRGGRALEMLEHTAPMPRGAGGGPVVDDTGAVLGLNALRGDPGFLLAIPSASVREGLERMLAGRQSPRLGVAVVSAREGRRMRSAVGLPERPGVLVRAVEENSPAARAGVLAGDLLIRLGDTAIADVGDLLAALESASDGVVAVGIVRATEEREVEVELSERS